jgi:uncharacterized membrane protein YraQ (UPF0718 family)
VRGSVSLVAIFGAPLVLALLSLIGLIGALLADGLWDGIGAALLATGPATIIWSRLRSRRRTGAAAHQA